MLYGQVARISVLLFCLLFTGSIFKDSAFFFYCACSVHLRMVPENDFLRMDVPTKTKVFLHNLLICGKERS